MYSNYPVCPECGYQRNKYDKPVHPGLCPACGTVYAKWQGKNKKKQGREASFSIPVESQRRLFRGSLKTLFLAVPENVDKTAFYGRLLLFIGVFLCGWSFILGGIDWQSIGGSFLHNINLPFHEFGHLLFMPLGRFWHILGGSLFQVLLPLCLLLAFSIQQKNNFAGSIMLWWSGQNFIDVSPYIADAQLRSLPLILGLGEESHDWGNLLTMTGHLEHTQTIATASFSIGCCIIIVSNIWSVYLLVKQRKVIE